ncbi:MAG: hypothetical protein C0506_04575 [Anaerolinea sp.]|nr:hypothetical protein [Anaerolinea sp.]
MELGRQPVTAAATLTALQRTHGNQHVQRILVAAPGAVQRDAVDDLLGDSKKPVKDRFSTAIADHTPTLAQLRGFLDGASQPDRETISSDATLMAKAKTKLAAPDYLSLLLALRVKKTGSVAHKSAEEADKLIVEKLSAYTAGAVKAGRKVSGQVAVLDGADWTMAYEREFGDDGEEATTNAFVDNEADRIFIHKDRGNPGTIIHEGMHKYAPNDLINEIGSAFNEGITEYFTRKICDSLDPPVVRSNYASNYAFAKKFVDLMGEATVAAANFDGKVADLKKKYTDSVRNWGTLIGHTKAGEWSKATTQLDPPAPVTPVTPTTPPTTPP